MGYLQIKKLKEIEESNGGTSTITKENFVSKVNEQYILNKSANIAEPSDSTVAKILGYFSVGAKSPQPKVKFKKLWQFNDPFSDNTEIFEALEKKQMQQFVDSQWIQPSSSDKPLAWIKDSGRVELNDNRAITSKLNWTLYISGKTKVLAQWSGFFCQRERLRLQ